jgi:integrase
MVQRRPAHGDPPKGEKIRFIARWETPGGKPRQKSFDVRKHAVTYENKMKADADGDDYVDPEDGTITLRDLAEEAAEEAAGDGTRIQHRYYATQLGDVGDTPISQIKRRHLQRWVNSLTEGRPWADGKPLGETTARNVGVWVCGLMKRAKKDRRIKTNPAEDLVLPDPIVEILPSDIPTVDQVHKLITVARSGGWATVPSVDKSGRPTTRRKKTLRNPDFARLIGFMASTGMRPSEIAGLRWQDISDDMTRLTVTVQATRDGKGTKPPKTKSGVRTIPLCPEVRDILVEQRDHGKAGPAGTVFGTRRGARYNAGSLVDLWGKFCEPAGLEHLTLYCLRHFYASMQIHAGTSPVAVSRTMGHKTPSITMQVYTHLWNNDLDLVAGAVSSLLWASDGQAARGGGAEVIDFPGQTG